MNIFVKLNEHRSNLFSLCQSEKILKYFYSRELQLRVVTVPRIELM